MISAKEATKKGKISIEVYLKEIEKEVEGAISMREVKISMCHSPYSRWAKYTLKNTEKDVVVNALKKLGYRVKFYPEHELMEVSWEHIK